VSGFSVPSREKLVTFLIDQYAYGISALATSKEGLRLAQAFLSVGCASAWSLSSSCTGQEG